MMQKITLPATLVVCNIKKKSCVCSVPTVIDTKIMSIIKEAENLYHCLCK